MQFYSYFPIVPVLILKFLIFHEPELRYERA